MLHSWDNLSRINIFWSFSRFPFFILLFQMLNKRQSTKRKQTLRTLNLCSKLQRKEKQPSNKLYTQEKGPFNQIQLHRITKTQFICRHMTYQTYPYPLRQRKPDPARNFPAVRVTQKGNRRTFAWCNGATREFAGWGGISSEWSLCSKKKTANTSVNFEKKAKKQEISSSNLVSREKGRF